MTAIRMPGPRAPEVAFTVDGIAMRAPDGESLAVALGCAGVARLRHAPRTGAPRGAFCFMGVCQECAVTVDGALRQACLTPVRAGMVVALRGSL